MSKANACIMRIGIIKEARIKSMIERWSRRKKEKSDIDIVVFDPGPRATLKRESAAMASNTNHARRKTSNKKSYNDVKFYKARESIQDSACGTIGFLPICYKNKWIFAERKGHKKENFSKRSRENIFINFYYWLLDDCLREKYFHKNSRS